MSPPTTTSKAPAKPKPADAERVLRADARRNRERVLAAAHDVFSEDGLDAQIDDIARRAKVGVGTVYRHFPNKDDLLAALAAERFEWMAERARAILPLRGLRRGRIITPSGPHRAMAEKSAG